MTIVVYAVSFLSEDLYPRHLTVDISITFSFSFLAGKCATTPSARARRAKRSQLPLGLCPVGLNGSWMVHVQVSPRKKDLTFFYRLACPISPFSKSRGYECIDTNEEIE